MIERTGFGDPMGAGTLAENCIDNCQASHGGCSSWACFWNFNASTDEVDMNELYEIFHSYNILP